MEDKAYIYNLIISEYANNLQEHQQEQLKFWIELSDENKTEYCRIIKILTYYDRLSEMKQINVDRDLLLVKERLNRQPKNNTWLIYFQRVAAILLIPLLIYTAWDISGFSEGSPQNISMKSSETAFGVRSQIKLNDGTEVWINSGSKLIYPEIFTGNVREVKLIGEAYFHVKSDPEHPFYVDLNGYKVKATGTRFDISNYSEDKEITTYLESGKVSILADGEKEQDKPILLKEKESIAIGKTEKHYRIESADASKYLAWIDGALVFKNDNTYDLATRLGRWFNADIIIDDNLLKSDYVFTATFKQESLEEALKLLSYSSPIDYKIISGSQKNDSSFSKRKVIISKKK